MSMKSSITKRGKCPIKGWVAIVEGRCVDSRFVNTEFVADKVTTYNLSKKKLGDLSTQVDIFSLICAICLKA